MTLVTNQLINSPIERWVQAVEFVDSVNTSNPTNKPLLFNVSDFFELGERSQLAKRSKPSYQWQIDKQKRWYRIWFNESNLTIQIDLYFSNDEYQMNMYEIDIETCTTALSIIQWLYHAILGKKWGSPEILWATMEVIDEASEKIFGKNLCDALLKEPLNWSSSNTY